MNLENKISELSEVVDFIITFNENHNNKFNLLSIGKKVNDNQANSDDINFLHDYQKTIIDSNLKASNVYLQIMRFGDSSQVKQATTIYRRLQYYFEECLKAA